MADAIHQSFATARQADVGDVIADVVGSILGTVSYLTAVAR
jgi:VanZ family protein